MKKTFLISLALILCADFGFAQQLKGDVKDAKTGEKLPFVNVGIVGKGVGTVTDNDGGFNISVGNNATDSLKLSMIGYQPQLFAIGDIIKHTESLEVKLIPTNKQLKEVKITNHKYQQRILGNTTRSKSTNAGFTSNNLGNEIGEIIKIKRSPTWLKEFNASISQNASDSVMLRLNIYSVKDGLPDQNLLQQNILVTVMKDQDIIKIDLQPYHIMVENNFFVSLEWVKNSAGMGLKFSASLLSSPIIARETSQAKWEKIGIAGVGFNVLAEY
ncbi:MAG: carboxypeptidase-like regulatory domain-containing protein [Mucilaginibacter sp.]